MTAFQKTTVSALFLLGVSACTNSYEVPIETPLQPKLEIARFQRILVAGFLAGGTSEVDTNLETARLLRSQLRNESRLDVIDAEVLDLLAIAELEGDVLADQDAASGDGLGRTTSGAPLSAQDDNGQDDVEGEEDETLSEEELEAYESIFANVSYWRQLGEEHQSPLIVTGTVYFTSHQRSGMVAREREIYDNFGRRRVVPMRAYRDRKGFVLNPKFIFIDGGTGVTLHTERHREEVLYDVSHNSPALSSYFELMDRLLPSFLGALADQSIRGTRTMLR